MMNERERETSNENSYIRARDEFILVFIIFFSIIAYNFHSRKQTNSSENEIFLSKKKNKSN